MDHKTIEKTLQLLQAVIYSNRELKAGYIMDDIHPPRVTIESDLIAITFNSIHDLNNSHIVYAAPGAKYARVDYVDNVEKRIISRDNYRINYIDIIHFNNINDCIHYIGPSPLI